MKKHVFMMIAMVSIFLLVLAGCGSGSTGAVPRAPAAPSGGGCGIAAPADNAPLASLAENTAANSAL